MTQDSNQPDSVKDSSSDPKPATDTGKKEPPARAKVYVPNVKWILVWGIVIAATFFLHFASEKIEDAIPFIDQAIRNLLTALAIMFVPISVMTWFCFYSDHKTRRFRRWLFAGFLLLHIGGAILFGAGVELDGNLTPVGYHWPWSQPADMGLAKISKQAETAIDLKTETPNDFPQFLGPNRNGRLDDTYLAYDWEKQPPKLLWKQPIGAGHSGFATRNGYAVTMEQRGENEITSCYEIETGDLIWAHAEETRHKTPMGKIGPRSTPTIFGGFVYSLGANGTLLCVDGATGSVVWRKELFDEFNTSIEQEVNTVKWGRSASPLVYEDTVVVPAGGPPGGPFVSLVAYNRTTGEEIWRGGDQQISYASPILAPHFSPNGFTQVIVIVNEAKVTAHNKNNGDVVWSIDREGNSTTDANTSQPVILPGSQFLLTKGYGLGAQLIQFQGGELNSIWKNNTVLKTKFTNAVFYRTYAFALSDGRLECVDLRNGKRVWKSRKSYGHGQILLCGSELLVLAEKGYLALVRAWGGTEEETTRKGHVQFTSFQAIDGITWNTIAMHGNRLLVRNSQEAACYEMPLRQSQD